jgi:hypothetical protein
LCTDRVADVSWVSAVSAAAPVAVSENCSTGCETKEIVRIERKKKVKTGLMK